MIRQAKPTGSVENDPGCVKTLRGIIAPGILVSTVMRRAKKRKNLSSARHYDQMRFRFHTTKTQRRHPQKYNQRFLARILVGHVESHFRFEVINRVVLDYGHAYLK
jgi:hypothetical protein